MEWVQRKLPSIGKKKKGDSSCCSAVLEEKQAKKWALGSGSIHGSNRVKKLKRREESPECEVGNMVVKPPMIGKEGGAGGGGGGGGTGGLMKKGLTASMSASSKLRRRASSGPASFFTLTRRFSSSGSIASVNNCQSNNDGKEKDGAGSAFSSSLVNHEQLPTRMEDFTLCNTIGVGGFGIVVLGLSKSVTQYDLIRPLHRKPDVNTATMIDDGGFSTRTVALKCIPKQYLIENKKVEMQITRELRILKAIGTSSCPFIVKFHFACQTPTKLVYGLEYCPGGDFFSLLNSPRFSGRVGSIFAMDLAHVQFYAGELAIALDFLHQQNIIYGDLKSENVTIAADGHVRLVDFGLATILDSATAQYNPQRERLEVVLESGTLAYAAPESLMRKPSSFESDWWSFGILCFEMAFGFLPWIGSAYSQGPEQEDVQRICRSICLEPLPNPFNRRQRIGNQMVQQNLLPSNPNSIEALFQNMMEGLTRKEQTARLGYHGFHEIANHPFFTNFISWDRLKQKAISPPYVPSLKSLIDISHFDLHDMDADEPHHRFDDQEFTNYHVADIEVVPEFFI